MRSAFGFIATVVAIVCTGTPTWAQKFPDRPIRLIIPYNPGGSADFVGRTLAQALQEDLGQPVVSENRGGAAGTTGATVVARSPADGYTLLVGDPSLVINMTMQARPGYDALKDLQTVSIVSSSPGVLVVWPGLPVKSVADLLAYGKAHPNKLNMASAGTGTPMHLAGELFKMRTGLDATHIPYKGIGPAYADLMSGKVEMAFSSIAGAIPFTENNQMRALAVTGSKRSELYPDVPTLAETGLKDYEVDLWFGIFAPRPLPPDILKLLNEAVNRVLAKASTKEAFARVSFTPRGTTPEEGDSFLKSDYEKWRDVVVQGKIGTQ